MIRAPLLAIVLSFATEAAIAQTPVELQNAAVPASAATAIPRTPEGRPNFQGVWSARFNPTTLERVPGATMLEVNDEEAAKLSAGILERRKASRTVVYDPDDDTIMAFNLPRVDGQWRTSLVTDPSDGKAPMTPAARDLIKKNTDAMREHGQGRSHAEGPEQLPLHERCLGGMGRAPLIAAPIEVLRQVVQTGDHLMILTETLFGEVRIVGIDARPRPRAIISLAGDSTARWEGDELVVETTGLSATHAVMLVNVVIGPDSKVVERLSFLSPDELLYRFTVVDPAYYSAPWSAEYSWRRTDQHPFEAACHEGNYGLTNILLGAREIERRLSKSAKSAKR